MVRYFVISENNTTSINVIVTTQGEDDISDVKLSLKLEVDERSKFFAFLSASYDIVGRCSDGFVFDDTVVVYVYGIRMEYASFEQVRASCLGLFC